MVRWIVAAAATMLLAASAWSQPQEGDEAVAPVDAVVATAPAPVEAVTFDFPGGGIADLCAARQALLGVRTVPLRPYGRVLQAVSWTSGGDEQASAVPLPVTSDALQVAEGALVHAPALDLHLAQTLWLGVRPGWLLEPKGSPEVAPPRSIRPTRDGETIAFIDFRANPIGLPELRQQLAAYSRLPILLAEGSQLRDERLPIYAQGITVADAIRALAQASGLEAVPVDVAFDLESDLADYLACVSDSEVIEQTQLLTVWDSLSGEEKQRLLDSILSQYKRLPDERRAEVRRTMFSMIESIQARLEQLGPQAAEGVSASLARLYGDLVQWYSGLEPGDRGELSGLFGTMNSLFGGAHP
jgi:hypothetical protein